MPKHKQEYRAIRKGSQYPRCNEAIDMEMNCVFCKTRLYVPDTSIETVLTSLRLVGRVILVCHVCEQAQLVSSKVLPGQSIND